MMTIFERIPDLFVQIYDDQFQIWAREFRTRGNRQAIRFRRPGMAKLYDEEGREVHLGAWLVAEPLENGVMKIRPATDQDEEFIAAHCREMRGLVLQ